QLAFRECEALRFTLFCSAISLASSSKMATSMTSASPAMRLRAKATRFCLQCCTTNPTRTQRTELLCSFIAAVEDPPIKPADFLSALSRIKRAFSDAQAIFTQVHTGEVSEAWDAVWRTDFESDGMDSQD